MEAEYRLPTALVKRLIRDKLDSLAWKPTMVQASGQKAVVLATTVFINYISAIAAEIAKEKKRVSISQGDVLDALRDCDFDDIVEALLREGPNQLPAKAPSKPRAKRKAAANIDVGQEEEMTAANTDIGQEDVPMDTDEPGTALSDAANESTAQPDASDIELEVHAPAPDVSEIEVVHD